MKTQITRLEAIYTIAGTSIGAGILALPTAMALTGLLPGLVMLVITGGISILTALYIVETSLRTGPRYHMPALAEHYLGKAGLLIMFAGIMVFVYGALCGYLSAAGQLIYQLSGKQIPYYLGVLIYFALGGTIVYWGLKLTGFVEVLLFSIMIVLVFLIAGMVFPYLNPQLAVPQEWNNTFSILGVTLFAYAAHVVVPSIAHGLKHDRKGLIFSTLCGFGGPMLLYIIWVVLFTLVIPRGDPGQSVAYDHTVTLYAANQNGQPATVPLGHIVGGSIMVIGSLFALFSTFTSYLGFSLSLTDCWVDVAKSFRHHLPRFVGLLLTVVLPLILALSDPKLFIAGIQVAGIYGGSIFMGILPPVMVLLARRHGDQPCEFSVPGRSWLPIAIVVFFVLAVLLRTWQLIS